MSDQHGPWPPAAPWIHEGWKQLQAGDTSEVSAVKQVALWPLRKREAVFWDLIGQKAAGEADRETEMNPLLLWSHLYIQHFGGVCFHFWCSGDALFRGYASCQHWCDRWASCTSSDWPQSGAVTLQKQLGAAFWFKKIYVYPEVFEFGALCGSVNAAQADIFVLSATAVCGVGVGGWRSAEQAAWFSVRIDHSWSDGIDVLEVRGVHFQLILVVCETFGV